MNDLIRALLIALVIMFFGWLLGLFAIDQVEILTGASGYGYL